jgi:hypothetical protein
MAKGLSKASAKQKLLAEKDFKGIICINKRREKVMSNILPITCVCLRVRFVPSVLNHHDIPHSMKESTL